MLTARLLPLLRRQMECKEDARKICGYTLQGSDDVTTGQLKDFRYVERYLAQLNVVTRVQHFERLTAPACKFNDVGYEKLDVWVFMSCAEPLLLVEVKNLTFWRLTRATIHDR